MANLLERASIVLTPTAYNNGEALCVKPEDGSGDFQFSRATEGTRINSLGLVEVVANNLPRINYEGFSYDGSGNIIPDSGCGHWLWENQSTNLITQSELFSDSSWIKEGGATIDLNTEISPTGSLNASYLQAPIGTNITPRIAYSFTSAAGTSYVGSVFLKKDNIDFIRILSTGATASTLQAYYNISNGTLGAAGTPSKAKIENYGNGWYRLSLIIDAVNSNSIATFRVQLTDGDGAGVADFNGTEKNIIFGAQLENQTYSTSYIPTDGTQKTRNQDLCTNGGSVSTINSTEGVLYAEIAALADDGTNRYISLNNGGTTDYLFFRYRSDNNFQIRFRSGNVDSVNTTTSLANNLDFNKIAFSYKLNEFKIFVNGLQVGSTITSGSSFSASISNLDFGSFNGGDDFYGKTKAIAVFSEALTDEELTLLTTI